MDGLGYGENRKILLFAHCGPDSHTDCRLRAKSGIKNFIRSPYNYLQPLGSILKAVSYQDKSVRM